MADLIKLPTDLSKQYLNDIIGGHFGSDDFTLEIKEGSKKGDNYLGIIYRAKAVDNKTKEKLSVIVKLPPQNESRRKQFFARPSFLREILFYDEVYPLFVDFQKRKGINLMDNGFDQIAKCFKTNTIELEEAVFLEDLKEKHFDMLDRHKPITYEHCRIVVEILGKFHALSFAMKDQHPEKFRPYTKLVDVFLQEDNEKAMNDWYDAMKQRAVSTLDADEDKELISKVHDVLNKSFRDLTSECINGEAAEPCAVLNHGDCWNNNILFKHKHGVPVEARLLDWQILRYSSPVCDLVYFIFSSTTKTLRDEHYGHLLRNYHQSLSDFLRRLGSDPEKLFPYSALEDQLKKFGRFGLITNIILLPVITTCADDVPNLEEMAENLEHGITITSDQFSSEGTQDVYKDRMSSVLKDMARLGYI